MIQWVKEIDETIKEYSERQKKNKKVGTVSSPTSQNVQREQHALDYSSKKIKNTYQMAKSIIPK